MRLDQYLALVGDSKVEDWRLITRPTFRHHFSRSTDEKGEEVSVEVDEHRVVMSFVPNIRITLAYGLVGEASYRIDPKHKFGTMNARSELVDCFYDNILVHRETVVRVARQRCVLPEAADWTENPIKVPRRKARFARLVHVLAGPLTEFDEYFKEAGMVEVEAPWP
jgi:hypothetical protein